MKTTDKNYIKRLDVLREKEANDETLTAEESAEMLTILRAHPFLGKARHDLELDLSRD